MDEVVQRQFDELIRTFPNLSLNKDEADRWVVAGELLFRANFEEMGEIEDCFAIRIVLPHDYPKNPPQAFEVGDRIPRKDDYHINKDGDMCLAASIELRKKFFLNPTLLHFVKKLVVPFLYAFSFQERFGKRPWGELSHGDRGVLEYYQEIFDMEDFLVVLRLLKLLADDNYRGHLPCPCDSGTNLRKCHGKMLLELKEIQLPELFLNDMVVVLNGFSEEERKLITGRELPNAFMTLLKHR